MVNIARGLLKRWKMKNNNKKDKDAYGKDGRSKGWEDQECLCIRSKMEKQKLFIFF